MNISNDLYDQPHLGMKNVDNLETLPHGEQLDEGAIFAESQDHPNLS